MKTAAIFLVVLLAIVAEAANQKFSAQYDNVNIDEILKNDRLIDHYYKCLMLDKYRCSADGLELKKSLPDALANGCTECTEKQREGSEKVLKFMIDNKPDKWKKLEAKYDPTGAYRIKYRDEAKKIGIEI